MMQDNTSSAASGPPADLLRAAVDAVDELFFLFDSDGRVQYWNRAVCEVTGYTAEQLGEKTPASFVVESDSERVESAVAELLETGQARPEVTLRTADDDRIPYEFCLARLTDGNSENPWFVGIGREITERREIERQREAITGRMTDAFHALDEEWRVTYLNDEAHAILSEATEEDLSREEMVGRELWEIVPEAVDTSFYEKYHEAVERQETVTLEEYYEPLDTWFLVRAYPSESGISIYFRDISERRKDRVMIERREQALREMYEVTANSDLSFSEKVAELLEIGADLLGTTYGTLSRFDGEEYVFEAVHPLDGTIQAGDVVPVSATNCERAATTEQTLVIGNLPADAPDLAERAGYQEWGIACYVGAPVMVDGSVYGTFCFYDEEPRAEEFSEWEVTLVDLMSQWVGYELERQQVRERLERQNAQLEQFTSIVSHDLRNPLNVLMASLDVAEETGDGEHFDRCHRAVDRMETLIEDLLSLAQAGEQITAKHAVSLAEIIDACWAGVATADASLVVDSEQTVQADASRLQQIVENLVRNAVEHGSESVTVTVGDLDDGFYVADDGPGIPEEEREAVFDAGYSTSVDGTGFGLNIVEEVAKAHGWKVRVVESNGGGARFEFTGVDVVE